MCEVEFLGGVVLEEGALDFLMWTNCHDYYQIGGLESNSFLSSVNC